VLREHELAVDDHVELATVTRDDRGLETGVLQLGRDTRGLVVVAVSDGAVEDLGGHGRELTVGDGAAG